MSGWVSVRLSPTEALSAAIVGARREIVNLWHDRPDSYNANPADGWRHHIVGATGEMVVAKELGVFWAAAVARPDRVSGDVAGMEVRARPSHDGNLIVHPDDPDDALFVLVTGMPPELRIHGCIRGGDAKRQCWWQTFTGRPCYFVPASALNPLPGRA